MGNASYDGIKRPGSSVGKSVGWARGEPRAPGATW
jgi:hypothetical protein